jgi:hypothetical protein
VTGKGARAEENIARPQGIRFNRTVTYRSSEDISNISVNISHAGKHAVAIVTAGGMR